MVFEHPMPGDVEKYASEIKSDLGWRYSATLVLSMIYFLDYLQDPESRTLNKFFLRRIRELYGGPMYWLPFRKRAERIKRKEGKLEYRFVPRPNPASVFTSLYVNWSVITSNYQLGCVEHVLNLWGDIDAKSVISEQILESMSSNLFYNPRGKDYDQVRRFLNNYIDREDDANIAKRARRVAMKAQKDNKGQADQEKKALLGRIAEQDAEIVRLRTLLSDKKNEGKERRFTLVQIVDYCKKCFDYGEVQPIEKMLLRILFNEGSGEDYELIASIVEEFKKRTYGNTYIEKQTVIPNVGNYNAEVKTQNNNFPMPTIGQAGPKQLEQ